MEELTYKEFLEKYKKPNKLWKFNLFRIQCVKCSSTRVEFNSDIEIGTGYYGDIDKEGKIIVKCHGCGNAFTLELYQLEI